MQIHIRMHVKADCSSDQLNELLSVAQRHSPVCNTRLPTSAGHDRACRRACLRGGASELSGEKKT
jgi:hypothetical protein